MSYHFHQFFGQKGFFILMPEELIREKNEILFIKNETDPYKLLGINYDAELESITKAYRNLAKKYHPDLYSHKKDSNQSKEIELIFTKITVAFNKLKDPNIRKQLHFEKKHNIDKKKEEQKPVSTKLPVDTIKKEDFNFSFLFNNTKLIPETKVNRQAEDYFNKGLELLNKYRYEDAVMNLKSAIKLEPQVAKYHSYLGLVYKIKGWDTYAGAEFKIALHYDPNDQICHENPTVLSTARPEIELTKKKSGLSQFFSRKIFRK
jgi:tetratricopeptide (TPR) repeat protein